MDQKWISFEDELPQGTGCIILFSRRQFLDDEFPGIPVMASNPEYARENAKKQGWTHWCRIPYPLPTDEENLMSK